MNGTWYLVWPLKRVFNRSITQVFFFLKRNHPGWYLVYMIFIILHKVRVTCLTKYKRFNKQKKRKTKYNLCYRYTVLKLTYVLLFVYYYRVCYEMFYIIKYLWSPMYHIQSITKSFYHLNESLITCNNSEVESMRKGTKF